ncbi:MAG: radical SAM protein [Planctomycetes bacterium]|nr:radical SAM protein [Planctomycetota bacterium]
MKVLLLNPPGKRVYIRDYFCSKTTKSNYLFHPIDLVVLSGTLASKHAIEVLDCIAEKLAPDAARARIERFAPDAIVALVGSVSWDEDRAFLATLARPDRRVLAIGDVLQEDAERRLADEPWLAAALHDFTSDDVLRWLDGERDGLATMTVRRSERFGDGVGARAMSSDPAHMLAAHDSVVRDSIERGSGGARRGTFRVPVPRHELFPRAGYRFSFARSARFATVLTGYGCPYPCTFCVIGTLGYKTRPVEDALLEIDHVRALGIRELFVVDQTFGVSRKRALELSAGLAERGDLSWTAFTRPDTADDELLAAMKRAGCHTVILGIESADDARLALYRKGYDTAAIRAGVACARRHGLRTVGTFIVGLPEETEDSLRATLDFALELELDFLSLNMAVPRFGTPFRAEALRTGLARADELVMDQGGADAFLPTKTLDRERMLALKKELVRRFYLRPGYLWKRLASVRTAHELGAQVREGFALLARNV